MEIFMKDAFAGIVGGDKGARVGALPVELLRQTPVPS